MADTAAITTSAPGSLMLLGEHAVLHGHRALVCAINRRITVQLVPTGSDMVRVESSLGEYESPFSDLVDDSALSYVIQAIRQHVDRLPSGFDLTIHSEFSAEIGFGSSAAVTVAVHAAIMQWLNGELPDPNELFTQALETVHAVQGRGSGADLAASVFGGIIGYTTTPTFEHIPISLPVTAVYCGYKTPTPEVILRVEQMRGNDPLKYERIYAEMDAWVEHALLCLHDRNLTEFGSVLNRNQLLMEQAGVNTPELQQIIEALQASPDVFGAKISGSGMGDCAVGIGYTGLKELDFPVYHLEITPAGVKSHE